MAEGAGPLWPWLVLAVGAAVTYVWRGLGVALSGRIAADSQAMRWIACIAYALLAGLIARMIVLPVGPLAETSLAARLSGAAVALVLFFGLRRHLLVAVIGAALTLVGLTLVGA